MKKIVVKQLNGMKQTLSQNIKSIRSLLKASEALDSLIEYLSKGNNNAAVDALTETRKDIDKAIDDLIEHTDSLFKAYQSIAKNI